MEDLQQPYKIGDIFVCINDDKNPLPNDKGDIMNSSPIQINLTKYNKYIAIALPRTHYKTILSNNEDIFIEQIYEYTLTINDDGSHQPIPVSIQNTTVYKMSFPAIYDRSRFVTEAEYRQMKIENIINN